jgi:predicted phage-related endonuclease
MIYGEDEVKTYKGFRYVERHGMRFFILEGMSRGDWLRLRAMDGALGGSDVGTLMGWNYRQSRIELFYQKIGLNFNASETQTQYTYWGSLNERNIMYSAQYYDFKDPEAYMFNKSNDIKLRNVDELKFSVRNPAVPYLNANVDGLIDYDPKTVIARRLAESKTIGRQSAEMWESIPPYHLGQVIMYLHALQPILKEPVAEIYYLQDGNNFYAWEIPQNQILLEIIVAQCEEFYNRVKKGIEIIHNEKNIDKRQVALEFIEPDPDNTKAYEQFMKEAYKRKKSFQKVKGDQAINQIAKEYNDLDAQIKGLEKEFQKKKNEIWQVLSHSSANVIELEGGGKISFNKRLYVNPSK